MPEDPTEAWCRGFVAGWDALPATANPHPSGSEMANVWDNGWRAGEQRRNRPDEKVAKDLEAWRAYLRSGRPNKSH